HPAGRRGDAQRDREGGADPGADVGDEAQQRRQEAPEQGVGHAEEVEPHGQDGRVTGVDEDQHEEVTADALAGLVEGARRGGRVERAVGGGAAAVGEQGDEAVAQGLALGQDGHGQRSDQGGGGRAIGRGGGQAGQAVQGGGGGRRGLRLGGHAGRLRRLAHVL